MDITAPLLIVVAALVVVGVVVALSVKATKPPTKPLPPLRLSLHARERMEQRNVAEADILVVLRAPARVQRDDEQDSYRLEGDFPGKVLKVWVKEWPAINEVFVKTTAWQFEDEIVVPVRSVGKLIGRGGAAIGRIERGSGARIHVGQKGVVRISAGERSQIARARVMISEAIDTPTATLGDEFDVVVVKALPSGVLARTASGVQGRVHVTELRKLQAGRRVDDIGAVAPVGATFRVRVTKVDGEKTDFALVVP